MEGPVGGSVSLDEEFRAGTGWVSRGGRIIHRQALLPIVGPSSVVLHRVHHRPERAQVLHVVLDRGELRMGGRVGRSLRLKMSRCPARMELAIDAPRPSVLRIWNGWHGADGSEQMWSGNAGVVVDRAGAGWLLQCSDGPGEAVFADLVVLLQVTVRATPIVALGPAAVPAGL